jgi:hypothetical protein
VAKSEASALTKQYARSVLAPLRVNEVRSAVKAATAAVVADASTPIGRLRVHPPRLRVEKPARRGQAPRRYIRVLIRDRDRRVFHDVSVDRSGEIVEHLRDQGEQPPVSEEELREATDLLRGDKQLRPFLRRRGVDVEVISPAGESPDRRIALRLIQATSVGAVRELAVVELDLDVGEIVATRVYGGRGSQ